MHDLAKLICPRRPTATFPLLACAVVTAYTLFPARAMGELRIERLTEANWDALVPLGKEVDAIYGDYVLQNDHVIAVIGQPLPTRKANMTVGNCGGAVIDLTTRSSPNDQLSAFYPGGGAYRFHDPDAVEVVRKVDRVRLTLTASVPAGAPTFRVTYSLSEDDTALHVESTVENPGRSATEVECRDMVRADRTFAFGKTGADHLFWAHDEWFQQAYGIYCSEAKLDFSGSRGVVITYHKGGQAKTKLAAGESLQWHRQLIPARHRLAVIGEAQRRAGGDVSLATFELHDHNGPVRNAQFQLAALREDKTAEESGDESDDQNVKPRPIGIARSDDKGLVQFLAPQGRYQVVVTAVGRPTETLDIRLTGDPAQDRFPLHLHPCGYVQAQITDDRGRPIPCKVSFTGKGDTQSPNYGPDSGDFQVLNCVYSEDGTFLAELGPGSYDVIVSRGPEYDALFLELTVKADETTPLRGSLVRTVSTPGWISADFHSHSTPSGDNTGSQLGRVLNLLAENVEFGPCTEHNRISSYTPHLKRLDAEKWLATCPGMELTGSVLPVNHQNAFPLRRHPRTQDGGGPTVSSNPVTQIRRLAMWDDGSEKLVQENHPNLPRILGDKDEDGKPDEGFHDMITYMDVIEIHPPATILVPPGTDAFKALKRNPIFHWLQMQNRGYRITGVVNTDAHYNFHETGWIRNYVRSSTDQPAEIDPMEVVRQSKAGHVIMTTGPYLEVTASNSSDQQAEVGGDLASSDGKVRLKIRVQCANWFDINRVQILVNGRLDDRYNYTRRTHADMFGGGVVKFDQPIDVQVDEDAHLVVVAAGEGLTLGPVMGPTWGKQTPIAVTNPIFVDYDGGGFQPNGDLLGVPIHFGVQLPKRN